MRIAICDDNLKHLMKLESVLLAYLKSKQITSSMIDCFVSYEELKDCLLSDSGMYDFFFIDIELEEEKSGIDLAKLVRSTKQNRFAVIVFVTSYDLYAIEAYDVHPYGYIIKPADYDSISALMNEVIESRIEGGEYIVFLKKGKKHFSKCKYISKIETATNRSVNVYYSNGRDTDQFYEKMSEIEKKLAGKDFVRISRHMIINLRHIFTLYNNYVVMENGEKEYISRGRIKEVEDRFFEYINTKEL